MQYGKITSLIVCLLWTYCYHSKVHAQQNMDSVNLVFPKLVIVDQQKNLLLAFDQNRNAFEIPSTGVMKGTIDFQTYIENAISKLGLQLRTSRLAGIFTYYLPNKQGTYIRPYFVIETDSKNSNTIIQQKGYKWFTLKQAIDNIPYPASLKIIEKIFEFPSQQWAATFEEYGYTNPLDKSKIVFKTIRDFYKLN